MLRLALSLVILAAPATAQDTTQLCSVSADIAGAAVSQRASGQDKPDTVSAITGDLQGDTAGFAAAVPHIVDWVWTLPEDQLTDEVAEAYEAACLAQ
ncbi:MAG: DNA primase [Roseovarius sp.]